MDRIQLTMKESKRIRVIEQLSRKEITIAEASELLSLSTRQVSRARQAYESAGLAGLAHKGRGRQSDKKIPEEQCLTIVSLIKEFYWDYGPTLASEVLSERHEIQISKETIRQLMIKHDLWRGKVRRKKYRQWRKPKSIFGQMAQVDASWHDWFEGRAPWAALIKFADDATGMILAALFAPSESYKSVVQATVEYFTTYGMPNALYSDKGRVFRVNHGNDNGDLLTQYEYALSMLNVEIKHANTPQAKGRIERGFQTDQDRLIKAMRLEGISSLDAANQFLKDVYIPLYNRKFSRPAEIEGDAHRPLNDINLNDVFCIREERTVQNNWTIKFRNIHIQICSQRPAIVKPKDVVTVCQRMDGTFYITIRSQTLDFTIISSGPEYTEEPHSLKRGYKPARHVTHEPSEPSGSNSSSKTGHFHFAQK